jgi:hypothetical protein
LITKRGHKVNLTPATVEQILRRVVRMRILKLENVPNKPPGRETILAVAQKV